MSKKEDSRCPKCKNLDREKSNHNWSVCLFQPLDIKVVLYGSKVCEKFEPIDSATHKD